MIELALAFLPSGVRNLFNVRSHLRMEQIEHQLLIGHLVRFLF
jgi:hypothetical protein